MLSQKVDFKLNASSSLCPENIQRTFRMSEVERNVIDTSSIKGILTKTRSKTSKFCLIHKPQFLSFSKLLINLDPQKTTIINLYPPWKDMLHPSCEDILYPLCISRSSLTLNPFITDKNITQCWLRKG